MVNRLLALVWLLVVPALFGQARSVPLEVPLISSYGNVGRVVFRQTMSGDLNIDIQIEFFSPGEHGVHIHQNPVCDGPDFRTSGVHFNPDGKLHGLENPKGHHAGDFPENLYIDAKNNGHMNVTVHGLNMTPGSPHSVLDRSIVIHERPDDMKTDPNGGSGNRMLVPLSNRPSKL